MEQGPSASKETSTLVQNANGCGPVRPAGYYEKLAEKFSTETETIYLLQDPALPFATFKVHILPNRMAYKTSKEFIDDFFRCGAGGYFPKLASKKWLLFTENCGDMNQSDAVNNRCLEFEKTLEPSLQLRE